MSLSIFLFNNLGLFPLVVWWFPIGWFGLNTNITEVWPMALTLCVFDLLLIHPDNHTCVMSQDIGIGYTCSCRPHIDEMIRHLLLSEVFICSRRQAYLKDMI